MTPTTARALLIRPSGSDLDFDLIFTDWGKPLDNLPVHPSTSIADAIALASAVAGPWPTYSLIHKALVSSYIMAKELDRSDWIGLFAHEIVKQLLETFVDKDKPRSFDLTEVELDI